MRRHTSTEKRAQKARQSWGATLNGVDSVAAVFAKYTKGEAAEALPMLAGCTGLGNIALLPGPARVSANHSAAAETLSVLESLAVAHASAGCTAAAKNYFTVQAVLRLHM